MYVFDGMCACMWRLTPGVFLDQAPPGLSLDPELPASAWLASQLPQESLLHLPSTGVMVGFMQVLRVPPPVAVLPRQDFSHRATALGHGFISGIR